MIGQIFNQKNGNFVLETLNTAYVFKIVDGKYAVHLYYGKKGALIKDYTARPLGFASYTENAGNKFYFETATSEYPFFGAGDFGAHALRIRNKNANNVTCFEYCNYAVFRGRENIEGLPYAETSARDYTFCLIYKDALNNLILKTYYTVFYDHDVISRYVVLENAGDSPILIEEIKSLALDLPCADYQLISLYGAHYFERTIQNVSLPVGKSVISSDRGTSSHHFNPFIALTESGADETQGNVYGFNFVYSGSFENVVEKTENRVRVVVGTNGAVEGCELGVGEVYRSPEAVMTFSDSGLGQMSRNFHSFINECIIPKEHKTHPIVLNTWEAFTFDINEEKLLSLADKAVETGVDTLVIDDGWFSTRNDETSGLGDWWVNKDKFPQGLKEFSYKIAEKGLNLGIWIEPEMVNPDSELYRNHPEWCLNAYGRPLALSRNQLVLNMALPEVRNYLKDSFLKVFSEVKFNYIKWDMNRSLSMVGGNYAGANDNNLYRKFIEGVYDLHRWFNQTFPNVMIEGCSGGGGRYDMGMMKYVGQIWTSDNTYPADRARIQYGSLIAYPASVMSCHVSNPQKALESADEAEYRFKIASAGVLGYELDVISVSDQIRETIKKQIEEYKSYKDTVIKGEFYPVFKMQETYCFYYYEKQSDTLALFYSTQKPEGERKLIKLTAVDANKNYRLNGTDKVYTGTRLKEGIFVEFNKKADVSYFVKEN